MILFVFALQFTGCDYTSAEPTNGSTLYYIRSSYQYHSGENVIVGEDRVLGPEVSGTEQLVGFYLNGPVTEGLVSPFPAGTQLINVQDHSGLLEVTLSDANQTLSDARFSLACVCLGKTLLMDTDIIQVTFFIGGRSMTVNRDNHFITDEVSTNVTIKEVAP